MSASYETNSFAINEASKKNHAEKLFYKDPSPWQTVTKGSFFHSKVGLSKKTSLKSTLEFFNECSF